jgi:hypothetical protein
VCAHVHSAVAAASIVLAFLEHHLQQSLLASDLREGEDTDSSEEEYAEDSEEDQEEEPEDKGSLPTWVYEWWSITRDTPPRQLAQVRSQRRELLPFVCLFLSIFLCV